MFVCTAGRVLGKVSKPQGHPTAEPTAVVEVHL